MPEMLSVTMLIELMRLKKVALVTDGRFSGATAGPCVGHVSPEAYSGGTIGLLIDGDEISIDIPARSISVNLSEEEIKKRRKDWKPIEKEIPRGYMTRYRNAVSSASKGAIIKE